MLSNWLDPSSSSEFAFACSTIGYNQFSELAIPVSDYNPYFTGSIYILNVLCLFSACAACAVSSFCYTTRPTLGNILILLLKSPSWKKFHIWRSKTHYWRFQTLSLIVTKKKTWFQELVGWKICRKALYLGLKQKWVETQIFPSHRSRKKTRNQPPRRARHCPQERLIDISPFQPERGKNRTRNLEALLHRNLLSWCLVWGMSIFLAERTSVNVSEDHEPYLEIKGGCLIYCTKPATVGTSPANDTGFFLRFFMSITKILGDNR
jgi:hypothetical protein